MNFISTLKSITAAFIGVQSNDNRKRDLQEGNILHFIIAGVIAVMLFIGGLWLVVSLVLPS